MSAQKNKTILAITLAIVAVFLLGGVSFTFFPVQQQTLQNLPSAAHIMWIEPTAPNNSAVITGPVSTSHNYYFVATRFYPMDTICIDSDGNLNATNAPIQHQGNTYILTGNLLNQTLLIQKDNVILDGGGYTLQGWSQTTGDQATAINVPNRNNITIKDLNIVQYTIPIWLQNSTNVTIKNNNITQCYQYAILVEFTNQTSIVNNTILGSMIELMSCYNNLIECNTFGGSHTGVMDFRGGLNVITKNTFTSVKESIISEDANSAITQNIIVNGDCGISVTGQNFDVSKNSIINSTIAFFVDSINSQIYGNDVYNCTMAVMLNLDSHGPSTGNNTFIHNNFRYCSKPVLVLSPSNFLDHWDDGKEGNYWSSYTGADSNGDSIGDTAYVLAENCTDRYPLMQPYVAQSPDLEMGQWFFVAAAVAAAIGIVVVVLVYARFRGHR